MATPPPPPNNNKGGGDVKAIHYMLQDLTVLSMQEAEELMLLDRTASNRGVSLNIVTQRDDIWLGRMFAPHARVNTHTIIFMAFTTKCGGVLLGAQCTNVHLINPIILCGS